MDGKQIIETQDGSHSVYSEQFGVSYHSKYGAVQESGHVFIEAGLFFKALTHKKISILEIGFGTGLNAFLTLLEAEKRGLQIDYTAIEAYPLPPEQAVQLNYPRLLNVENRSALFHTLHQCEWNRETGIIPGFTFTKLRQLIEETDFDSRFDLIYFDAFAPDAQPELWELPVLEKMYRALKPNGVLVTYCAKGIVKRRLRTIGFEVEALKGPPGKREMTRGIKGLKELKC